MLQFCPQELDVARYSCNCLFMLCQENVSGLWLNCCMHDKEKKQQLKKKKKALKFHTEDPDPERDQGLRKQAPCFSLPLGPNKVSIYQRKL